jgi:hypothetical protein
MVDACIRALGDALEAETAVRALSTTGPAAHVAWPRQVGPANAVSRCTADLEIAERSDMSHFSRLVLENITF